MKSTTFLAALAAVLTPAVAMAAPADEAIKTYVDTAFAAMDVNGDGKVERSEFDTFMRARLARQAQVFNAAFAELDKNGNQGIDKKEAAANPTLLSHFEKIDANGNGTLDIEELRAAAAAAQAAEVDAG